MKICPNCQAENKEESQFCEACGYQFDILETPQEQTRASKEMAAKALATEPMKSSPTQQPSGGGNKKLWLAIGGLLAVVLLIIAVIFLFRQSDSGKTEQSSKASTEQSQMKTTESTEDATKYDDTIRKAKELTIAGKYEESALQLAKIPVSDLSKDLYAAVKEAVDTLSAENTAGMKEQQKTKESKEGVKEETTAPATAGAANDTTFTGDYAKWANTYTFYYAQSGQKHRNLTISANGGVTQTNNDGTQYFGQATIASTSGTKLSYNTDELYPINMPETKSINANVLVTIQWDNGGGTQSLYGYLSYSSRLVLTDGASKGSGVNEVWISY